MVKRTSFPTLMKALALSTALITLILASAYHFSPQGWLLTASISFGTIAYHFCMRLAVGYLVPKLTDFRFHPNSFWFRPRHWEAAFYKKLRVKHWKGRLPTYDPSQFSLAEQTREQILRNMCGAELVHEIIMVLSLLPIAFSPVFGAFPVFVSTSLMSALFDSLFVIAQRYNRPRLARILGKLR